jgi:hypothetical protein
MEPIDDLDALRAALKPLAERSLVVFLGAEGRRGTLITHGFHAPKEIEILRSHTPVEDVSAPAAPLSRAQPDEVAKLASELQQARQEIADLRTQMQQVQETLRALKESLGG